MYYIILIHYYITIIRIIFPIIFPIVSQRTIISLYYITIISIIFTIISDYIRVLHPIFQELADTNCRPMHPEMTDKSPAASSQLPTRSESGWPGKLALWSKANIFSQTKTIIRIISCIIPIILIICSGFSSLYPWAMHCRPTHNNDMRCIMPLHQEESSCSSHMGSIHALLLCIIRIISLLFAIILIIS